MMSKLCLYSYICGDLAICKNIEGWNKLLTFFNKRLLYMHVFNLCQIVLDFYQKNLKLERGGGENDLFWIQNSL